MSRSAADPRTNTASREPSQGVVDDAGAQLLRGFPINTDGEGDAGSYRLLVLGPAGQLLRFFYLDCEDAAKAMESARRLAAGRPSEVWRCGALIGRCGPAA